MVRSIPNSRPAPTSAQSDRDDPSKIHGRNKGRWLDQIHADDGLTRLAREVAYHVAQCVNRERGFCWKTLEQLGELARVSNPGGHGRRSITRAIAQLEARGHLDVTRPARAGRGRASEYRWIVKNGDPPVTISGSEAGNGDSRVRKCGLQSHPNFLNHPLEESSLSGEGPVVELPGPPIAKSRRGGHGSPGQRELFPAAISSIPRDWHPVGADRDFARSQGWSEEAISQMADSFRDWHIAKGSLQSDWSARWRNWVRNERKPDAQEQSTSRRRAQARGGTLADTFRRRLAEELD